jgi:hypothetical protein
MCVGAQAWEAETRANPMADNYFRPARLRDPIAELARLIGQVHGGRTRANNFLDEETASVGYDNEPPRLPPAPRLSVALNAPEQAHELDERVRDDEAETLRRRRWIDHRDRTADAALPW